MILSWDTYQHKTSFQFQLFGYETQAYPAGPQIQNRVNKDIAQAHNLNGLGSLPPFVTDYTFGPPVYLNPRDHSLLL